MTSSLVVLCLECRKHSICCHLLFLHIVYVSKLHYFSKTAYNIFQRIFLDFSHDLEDLIYSHSEHKSSRGQQASSLVSELTFRISYSCHYPQITFWSFYTYSAIFEIPDHKFYKSPLIFHLKDW